MDQLFLSRKKQFQRYVNKLHLNSKLKEYIVDEDFIHRNPKIYLFYPEIFFLAFVSKSRSMVKQLEHLNISGYLFYRSILEIDTAIDRVNLPEGKNPEKHVLPILSSICQEESIKILTSIFPLNSNFWKTWGHRREEYFQALLIDKRRPENFSLSEFENYADYKSAFGKIAIDTVYFLNGCKKKKTYIRLLNSHRNFSIGLQLLDDIVDFKEDYANPQVNFAFLTLREELKNKGIDFQTLDEKNLAKHLYVQGVSEKLITLAIDYFKKSLEEIKSENLNIWKASILKKIKEAEMMLIHINAYEKTIYAKTRFSNCLFSVNSSTLLMDRINFSRNFILKNQNSDGSWNEFYNNAGLSNVWSTGFILSNLFDSSVEVDSNILRKASSFLMSNKQGELWGYNTSWIEDTDSTTFALMALASSGQQYRAGMNKWMVQQKKDGGFSTYSEKDKLISLLGNEFVNVKGWTQSHICVSSVAFFSISKMGLFNSPVYKKLSKYILANKSSNCLWNSYWWTSPVYSTSYALRGLLMSGYTIEDREVLDSFKALAKLQNDDGSFCAAFNEKSPFFTAMALSAFSFSIPVYNVFKRYADKGSQWLLENQFDDGSFASSYSLQIPEAGVTDTSTVKDWQKTSKRSTNVLINDFMRLFSTVCALQALSAFSKVNSATENRI